MLGFHALLGLLLSNLVGYYAYRSELVHVFKILRVWPLDSLLPVLLLGVFSCVWVLHDF